MQLSDFEKRRIGIWEQMREIEGELFVLTSRSGETEIENAHRFERLREDRTRLARELLLNEQHPAVYSVYNCKTSII